MQVHFTFRKVESTDALKKHVQKRLEKLEKYIRYPLEVHVTLSVDRPYHSAEITLHAEHRALVAEATTKDLYESIDRVAEKIEIQLKKERERRKGHKSAHLATRPTALRLARDVDADLPHREKSVGNSSSGNRR